LLKNDITQLQKEGWKIEYGASGGGSYAQRNTLPPKIVIDSNQANSPTQVIQTLAHEVGHATYSYRPDFSSKDAYVNGALEDEGAATLNNLKSQREILSNGGPDIGIAGNSGNHAAYNMAYDKYLSNSDAASARREIGEIFGKGENTSTTGQPYSDYYGSWYDSAYSTSN
jgi:type VI secretion system secreted protein VgrG